MSSKDTKKKKNSTTSGKKYRIPNNEVTYLSTKLAKVFFLMILNFEPDGPNVAFFCTAGENIS